VVGAGAQVLGGFVVGDGARIGSNAVVVKPVPAGATAVGNPARVILPNQQTESSSEPIAAWASAASQCHEELLNTRPLQEMLNTQTARQNLGPEPSAQDQEGFSAYAVDAADTDPLVRVLHELIDHTAKQDARIEQLCKTIESMGEKISPRVDAEFDPDRLNKLVD
jgi:serine O-acetyltransferase